MSWQPYFKIYESLELDTERFRNILQFGGLATVLSQKSLLLDTSYQGLQHTNGIF